VCVVVVGSNVGERFEGMCRLDKAPCVEEGTCTEFGYGACPGILRLEAIEQEESRRRAPGVDQIPSPDEPVVPRPGRLVNVVSGRGRHPLMVPRARSCHARKALMDHRPTLYDTPPIRQSSGLALDVSPQHNALVDNTVITSLGGDVFMIDSRMGGYEGITSTYVILGSRPCLIETGTATSAPVVVAALGSLGIGADDLASIVVTHIHLDHAGGVGDIAEAYPKARVVVHERGARHLASPERLVASARRVFGDSMDRLFGELRATEVDRIDAIGESGTVDLGDGRYLEVFANPGHASHHIGLLDSLTADLYTGDAAGVYVPQTADVRPATPPPDFDLTLTLASIAAMRERGPQRLLFSHFGPVLDVEETLDASVAELHDWVDTVRRARGQSPDLDHAIQMVRERDRERHAAFYSDPNVVARFEELSSIPAQVSGISRWLDAEGAVPA